jgi:hypothetical protein
MDTNFAREPLFDTRKDALATLVVVVTIVVSALCYAYLMTHAGIVIAE